MVTAQQSGTNAIGLYFPVISQDGQRVATRQVTTNSYTFDQVVNNNNAILYRWTGVDLSTRYVDNPVPGGGYLKVYKNDDSTEDNFILNTGADVYPLPVSSLTSQLTPGENKLLFVYHDHNGPAVPTTKVALTFNYEQSSTSPQIQVIEPGVGSRFFEGVEKDFTIRLQNFKLSPTNIGDPNTGKLNVYHSSISPQNFLATISSSVTEGDAEMVTFNTQSLGSSFTDLPDSDSAQLIFALTDGEGNVRSDTQTSLPVVINYQNSLDIGTPRIEIIEPSQNRSSIVIDPDQKFVVQVENFDILTEPTDVSSVVNQDGQGYLQIFIDNQPVQLQAKNTEFTLKELGVDQLNEKITVEVKLVNVDNTDLSPEAKDSIDVIIQLGENDVQNPDAIENNNWRLIIVFLTIILVVGGIAILITRG